MTERRRGRRTPTEVDLTKIERQPDPAVRDSHSLRIGFRPLEFKFESHDTGMTIIVVAVALCAIFSAVMLRPKGTISMPTVVGVLLVDALILLPAWAYARWGPRRTSSKRRASSSSTRVLRPGQGQRATKETPRRSRKKNR